MNATMHNCTSLCCILTKPKGPVRENTTSKAFAAADVIRGFVMPKSSGLVSLSISFQWLRGMVGATSATGVFYGP